MGNLVEQISGIEEKINQILHNKQVKEEENLRLRDVLETKQEQIKALEGELSKLQQENQNLKTTNALLGSEENRRETKLKINRLIRTLNHCIEQLAT